MHENAQLVRDNALFLAFRDAHRGFGEFGCCWPAEVFDS